MSDMIGISVTVILNPDKKRMVSLFIGNTIFVLWRFIRVGIVFPNYGLMKVLNLIYLISNMWIM